VRNVIASLRLIVALLGVTSITATFLDTASRETINPFNFFGFFTMQSNILLAFVLGITAVVSLTGRTQTPGLQLARGCATTYIAVVGLVYNTLLAGLPGGVTLEWANNQLHIVLPIYAVLDWAIIGDRGPLPWNRLAIVTVYPIAWICVVLVRIRRCRDLLRGDRGQHGGGRRGDLGSESRATRAGAEPVPSMIVAGRMLRDGCCGPDDAELTHSGRDE
jgi:hypothetical protein